MSYIILDFYFQIIENAEINNIIKIMGLQYKKKYETREDLESLRYGKLMIMTDQDQVRYHRISLVIHNSLKINSLIVLIKKLNASFQLF